VYSSDIVSAQDEDGVWHVVVHSTATLTAAKNRQLAGF